MRVIASAMRVPLVTMCALLALGANACRGPYMSIFGVEEHYNSYIAQYGDRVTIFCSGTNSKYLNINHQSYSWEGGVQATTAVNKTTIKLVLKKPDIESHEYTCVDEETFCAATLIVHVKPVISIIAPNAHYKRIGSEVNYIVPVGEDYEVVCSGNSELGIRRDGRFVQTDRLNDTAVATAKTSENEQLQLWYECEHELNYGSASLKVAFDYTPAAVNFWCVEYNFLINCYWTVLSQYATYTLFYADEDDNLMRLYEDHIGTKKNRSCEWSMDDVWNHGLKVGENFSLVVESCNPIFCSNETYHFKIDNIKKIEAPVELKLLKTWTHTAVVTWKELDTTFKDNSRSREYKVTYRLPGLPEQDVNTSEFRVTCAFEFKGSSISVCQGKIGLPCPGKIYEINVFRKRRSAPRTNDAYWSDPASITLRTEPLAYSTDELDPVCYKETELLELTEELKSTERKLDAIRKVCQEKGLDVCSKTLSSVCISLNNTVTDLEKDDL